MDPNRPADVPGTKTLSTSSEQNSNNPGTTLNTPKPKNRLQGLPLTLWLQIFDTLDPLDALAFSDATNHSLWYTHGLNKSVWWLQTHRTQNLMNLVDIYPMMTTVGPEDAIACERFIIYGFQDSILWERWKISAIACYQQEGFDVRLEKGEYTTPGRLNLSPSGRWETEFTFWTDNLFRRHMIMHHRERNASSITPEGVRNCINHCDVSSWSTNSDCGFIGIPLEGSGGVAGGFFKADLNHWLVMTVEEFAMHQKHVALNFFATAGGYTVIDFPYRRMPTFKREGCEFGDLFEVGSTLLEEAELDRDYDYTDMAW